eukprot:1119596-Prymnesium_polylepis.1
MTSPAGVVIRFDSFTSRWTMDRAWMCASAPASCALHLVTSSSETCHSQHDQGVRRGEGHTIMDISARMC